MKFSLICFKFFGVKDLKILWNSPEKFFLRICLKTKPHKCSMTLQVLWTKSVPIPWIYTPNYNHNNLQHSIFCYYSFNPFSWSMYFSYFFSQSLFHSSFHFQSFFCRSISFSYSFSLLCTATQSREETSSESNLYAL